MAKKCVKCKEPLPEPETRRQEVRESADRPKAGTVTVTVTCPNCGTINEYEVTSR
jgi:RNase P subunit RPR2